MKLLKLKEGEEEDHQQVVMVVEVINLMEEELEEMLISFD
jgi:hypothetical protein